MNLKGQILFALVHWVLPGAATVFLLTLFRSRWPQGLDRRHLVRWGIPIWLLSRVVYTVALYNLPGFEGGGDFQYYLEQARGVLDGGVPGRDLPNYYGPLFPYMFAFGLAVVPGGAPMGILLVPLLADGLVVILGWRLGRRILGEGPGDWIGAWLLVSPLLWHQVVVRAADESVFLATLLATVLLLDQRRPLAAAFVLAVGGCMTKVTIAPYAAAIVSVLWLHGRSRWSAVALLLGVIVAIETPFVLVGADPFQFAKFPGDRLWWANLSSLAEVLPEGARRWVSLGTYGVLVLLAGLASGRLARGGSVAWRCGVALAAVHALVMIIQPYATANYICQGLVFVLLVLAARPGTGLAPALLVLLPLLGFAVAVTSATTEPLYQWGAAPLALLVHGGLLVHVLRTCRGEEGPSLSSGGAAGDDEDRASER